MELPTNPNHQTLAISPLALCVSRRNVQVIIPVRGVRVFDQAVVDVSEEFIDLVGEVRPGGEFGLRVEV